MASEVLKLAIEAMLERGIIYFNAFSWCFDMVDITIKSDVFEEESFVLSVLKQDWNDGPGEAVATELTKLLINGDIRFIPYQEKFGSPKGGSNVKI